MSEGAAGWIISPSTREFWNSRRPANCCAKFREDGELRVEIVRELYEQGYLDAVDGTTFDGICYVEARITVPGREYLNHLEGRKFEESIVGRARSVALRLLDAGLGFVVGVLTAWATGGGCRMSLTVRWLPPIGPARSTVLKLIRQVQVTTESSRVTWQEVPYTVYSSS